MSVYDDVKKAVEAALAPGIAEIRNDTTLIKADIVVIKGELRRIEEKVDTNLKRIEEKIDANHREVMHALNLDKRLALLEDREARKEKPAQ